MLTPSKAEIGHAQHRQAVFNALKGELAGLEKENGMRCVRGGARVFPLAGQIHDDTLEDQELHIKNEYSDASWIEIRIGHQGDDWDALVMITSSVCDTKLLRLKQSDATTSGIQLLQEVFQRTTKH